MRGNPQMMLGFAILFTVVGLLNGIHALRSGGVVDECLSALWLVGAAVWFLRYRAERRWREGR